MAGLSAPLRRLLRALLAALLACAIPAFAQQDGAVQRIVQAQFLRSDAATPPPSSAPWLAQALPDSWRESRPGEHGHAWYRMAFQLPADAPVSELHAVYIPVVGSTYALWVNGILVADGGGLDGPLTGRSAGFPQWATIPPQALRPGTNELHLHLRVAPNLRGGLTPPQVGPQDDVRVRYDRAHLWRVAIPRTLNAAVLALGLLVLLLWSRDRAQSVYGWCGAFLVVSAAWSLRNFDFAVTLPEVPSRAWEAFVLSGLAVARLMLLMFVLRFCGVRWPRTERVLVWAMLLVPVLLYAGGEVFMSAIRTVFYVACGVPMWASIALLARGAWTRRAQGAWLVLAALVLSEVLAVHDWLIAVNGLPFGTRRWQDYAAAVLTTGLVGALARRYFAAFAEVRVLNRELEDRVRQKAAELEASMRQVAAYELDAALQRERQRLMRDMHDGIGSQLITMTGAIERGLLQPPEVARLLRECIDDLRLVIDSLEPEQDGLAGALANLRYRFTPRLEAAGLSLRWDMASLPERLEWAPGRVLQVLRILQEALTNVIRHSGASHATVSAVHEAGDLLLTVRDQGRGGAGQRKGRGLENMRQRAALLGGTLDVRTGSGGTEVALRVPMH